MGRLGRRWWWLCVCSLWVSGVCVCEIELATFSTFSVETEKHRINSFALEEGVDTAVDQTIPTRVVATPNAF